MTISRSTSPDTAVFETMKSGDTADVASASASSKNSCSSPVSAFADRLSRITKDSKDDSKDDSKAQASTATATVNKNKSSDSDKNAAVHVRINNVQDDAASVSSSASSHDGTATTATLSPSPMYPSVTAASSTDLKPILLKTNSSKMIRNQESSAICVIRNKTKEGKKVQFSTITTRYFPMTVGDNPAVTRGVPLTIEWDCIHTSTKHLQASSFFDKSSCSPSLKRHGRTEDRLVLSSLERARILKDWGYTKMELAEAIYTTNKVRAQRQETADLEMAKIVKQQQQRQRQQQTRSPVVRAWNAVASAFGKANNTASNTAANTTTTAATTVVSPVGLKKV
ncbi:MAG: hypothetical protein SGILL_005195 [Bacillariaceae sp.]